MNRRSFLKSVTALIAAPAVAKLGIVNAESLTEQWEAERESSGKIIKKVKAGQNIGGLYKDNKLIAAFSSYEISYLSDLSSNINSMRERALNSRWEGSSTCEYLTTNVILLNITEEYEIILFQGEVKSQGKVIITSLSYNMDGTYMDIDVSFIGMSKPLSST